jgi:hypothetical protein
VIALSVLAAVVFVSVLPDPGRTVPAVCTYEMQVWNSHTGNGEVRKKVAHAYGDMRSEEIDQKTGCTVCSEDQVEITVPGIKPFAVCRTVAPRVRSLINDLIRDGAEITTVVGYHPIRSRGPVDEQGNRTEFSNHSYGTAVDINPGQNGLYDNCVSFGSQCRLLRGGAWRPGTPGTLTRGGIIVRSFKAAGFKWGGEIEGKQKDFMHFSLTGY